MEVSLLIKFGSKKHLEEMRDSGVIYCNTISYFANTEDRLRRDPMEAVSELGYYENANLQIKPINDPSATFQNLKTTKLHFKKKFEKPLGNLYCMSFINVKLNDGFTDIKLNANFNDFEYCLMILRQDIFKVKLENALSKLPFKTCMRTVEYLNLQEYTGTKNLFQKNLEHSWQEEIRLAIYTDKYKIHDPYIFSIGSIKDISEIIDCSNANWRIKVS